jgi:hypothetical protein
LPLNIALPSSDAGRKENWSWQTNNKIVGTIKLNRNPAAAEAAARVAAEASRNPVAVEVAVASSALVAVGAAVVSSVRVAEVRVVEAEAAVSSVPVVAAAEAGRSQVADARVQRITL